MNALKDISGEVYPLASLDEDGEEGTAACADEDDKNGADPQAEVSVSATARAAVWLLSNLEHRLVRSQGERGWKGGSRA